MEQFTTKSASVTVERLDPKILRFCKVYEPFPRKVSGAPKMQSDLPKPCEDYPGKPKISSRVISLQRIKLTEKHTKPFIFSLFRLRECDVFVERVDLNELRESLKNKPVTKAPEYEVTYTSLPTYQCHVCNKKYCNEKKLKYHVANKHDVINQFQICRPKRVSFSDVVEIIEIQHHRCRKCLQLFESYKLLKHHMKAKHKKRNKYVCHYCEKLFAERAIFKAHIKAHCFHCGQLFDSKMELAAHKSSCTGQKINFSKSKTKPIWKIQLAYKKLKKNRVTKTKPVIKRVNKKKTKINLEEFISQAKRPIVIIERLKLPGNCNGVAGNLEKTPEIVDKPQVASASFSGLPKPTAMELPQFQKQNKPQQVINVNQSNTQLKSLLAKPMQQFSRSEPMPYYVPPYLMNAQPPFALNSHQRKEIPRAKMSTAKPVAKVSPKLIWNKNNKAKTKIQKTQENNNFARTSIFNQLKLHCEVCNQYFTTIANLESHRRTFHNARTFQCPRCEEHFVWESLLQNHKCIRDFNVADTITSLSTSQSVQGVQFVYAYEVPIEF